MPLTRWLSLVFFLSGFASLIYQVVWQRLLTLYYGVGAISMALIGSIYMGGLGIGALLGGHLAEKVKNKILFYFLVEIAIGGFGLVSLPFLKILGQNTAGSSYILTFTYMSLFLLVPTIFMGITLPLLTKIFNHVIHNFSQTISHLYFINTIGAACGAIFSSYVIISFWGLDTAVYAAVVLNFVLAGIIFLVRAIPASVNTAAEGNEIPAVPAGVASTAVPAGEFLPPRIVYGLVFITGFLAIGYEILWFRVIGVLVKNSPYAFSTILFIYLLGIALGSSIMGRLISRNILDRVNLFLFLQFLIGISVLAIFLVYYYLTSQTPLALLTNISFSLQSHPTVISQASLGIAKDFFTHVYIVADIFFWPMIFVFLPTLLMGASFPLIAWLALRFPNQEGKTVGNVYFFNILGNVLGGVVTGFILLAHWGTEMTVMAFIALGILFGFFVTKLGCRPIPLFVRGVTVMVLFILMLGFFPKRGELYQLMHAAYCKETQFYLEEGEDSLVATCIHERGVYNFVNGTTQGGRPGYRFYAHAIEAASFNPEAQNALVIGYGTGSVTEIALKMKDMQKVTMVELSKSLMKNLHKIPLFENLLRDPRLDIIVDDGRRFLLRTAQRYDLVFLVCIRSHSSYSNNIYSKEFFELIGQHLSPSGVFLIWTDEKSVIPRTLVAAFKHVRLYAENHKEVFCVASNAPFIQNAATIQALLNTFSPLEQALISRSLFRYSADESIIKKMTRQYPMNQDWKPVSEYYLGLEFTKRLILKSAK